MTIASVAGGEVPLEPRSLPAQAGTAPSEAPEEEQEIPASVRRYLDDEVLLATVRSSPPVTDVLHAEFNAIFLPGGHGRMRDFPGSEPLAHLVGRMFDQGRIVAAVCHGPAGLVTARRNDGRPTVQGRRVNDFTNSEEAGVGLADVVPFLLEDRLKELGGRWENGPDWQPYAVRDGNLVTGQNPQSSELVAKHVLAALREGSAAS